MHLRLLSVSPTLLYALWSSDVTRFEYARPKTTNFVVNHLTASIPNCQSRNVRPTSLKPNKLLFSILCSAPTSQTGGVGWLFNSRGCEVLLQQWLLLPTMTGHHGRKFLLWGRGRRQSKNRYYTSSSIDTVGARWSLWRLRYLSVNIAERNILGREQDFYM